MKRKIADKPEDVKMQRYLEARADYSMAVLGEAFVRNGSGVVLNIRTIGKESKHSKDYDKK